MLKYVVIMALLCSTVSARELIRYPYWQMVSDIAASIESASPRPRTVSDAGARKEITYPFENLRHLRATDVLRAAKEGAHVARLQAALGKTEEEIEALVTQNVAIALEYLPMLIRRDEDIEEITLLMAKRDEDATLRMYLLKNSAPGFAAPSFLSISLPEIIDTHEAPYIKWVVHAATHPSEKPEVQRLALEIAYDRLLRSYTDVLQQDPAVQAYLDSEDACLATLMREDVLELSQETHLATRQIRTRFHDFARDIAGHIAEGSVRDETVKALTREILEDMRDAIHGINTHQIDTYLAGQRFTAPAFPTRPPVPRADPESMSERLDELFLQADPEQTEIPFPF